MAYEAVVSSVAERLDDLLIQEAPFFIDDMKLIHKELNQLICFMQDADSRKSEDEGVNNWVAQIRDLCYDLENVIDTFILNQMEKKRDGFLERLKRPFSVISELKTHHKVARQIERIKLKIDDISRSWKNNYIQEGIAEASSSIRDLQLCRRASALFEESEVVGLQDVISTLKKQLLNGEVRRCVISIVGMGGSGKTALAKKVYHDVKDDFDCHAFIYLSQKYVMKDVVMRIIQCVMRLSRREIEDLNEVELKKKLRDYLKEKRYLVVVDDIWSKEAWDDLQLILPDTGLPDTEQEQASESKNRSRVMLTTRIRDVAVHADSRSPLHEMCLLNEKEGWELFMKKVFPGAACPPELEETGRKIFAKCGGLPLAILVLGGLLARKDTTNHTWSRVLQNVNWHLSESSEQCQKILALSYWDLPHYLKPCFLYLGLFPEDYEIDSGRLIRLWIAEGFIEPKGDMIKEDVAEVYLEELVLRSMIQVTSRRSNDSIRTCRIHSLLRDFSISEARQNNFFAIHNDKDTSSSLTSARRLALHNSIHGYLTTNCSTAILRSILCFLGSEVPLSELHNIGGKLLRVLVVDGAEFTKKQLPKEVGAFVHLRYLELATIRDGSLPSSIGNLSTLQTLKLSLSGTLPNEIWNLVELRHLSAYNFSTEERPKLQNLGKLQTLCLMAGSWIEDGLGKLSNLRKLGICGDLSSHHEALSDSIDKLSNLRSLKLRDGHSIPLFESFSRHSVLYKMFLDGRIDKLPMLPPNLTKLTLQRSLLGPDVISTLGKLPHRVILRFLDTSVKE